MESMGKDVSYNRLSVSSDIFVQRITEIRFSYLDKNVPEFQENKSQGWNKMWTRRTAYRGANVTGIRGNTVQ